MKRQRGVVLLLALVLSLLLGLLTASALRDALVETRRAGYLRDGLLRSKRQRPHCRPWQMNCCGHLHAKARCACPRPTRTM